MTWGNFYNTRRAGMSMEGGRMNEFWEMPTKRYGTRMTRIGRIFTDIFDPCASASSAQSVFYRNVAPINHDKPQMNADECRCIPVSELSKIIHRKGRKERKARRHESLRPLRSLRLNAFSTLAHGRAPPAVHLRTSRAGG